MISYASDDAALFGDLAHYPAADHAANATRPCYDWDSGAYLGEIPEVAHTYSVVGNMNEFGLAISETTFGGLSSLAGQKGALISYGDLIWITLQRSKNAREAIKTMGELVSSYGYADVGESFSINDGHEVFILEMISKGPGEKGAVWVAQKVPDGYVSAHANQARIRTFPHNDPDTIFAADVVDFARKKSLYPKDAKDEDFSFSDVFDPVTFGGARFCEARVWSFFSKVAPGIKDEYLDYVSGKNLSHRMPLFVKPTLVPGGKLSLNDTFWHFRNHYEDTWFDDSKEVGSGPFENVYRYSPLTWQVDSKPKDTYVNERAISTQYTGWHFTAHVRPALPAPVRGILWFGPDDTKHSLNVPFYSGTTRVPLSWTGMDCMGRTACRRTKSLPGSITEFSFNSAHWIWNLIANYAYQRYELIEPEIRKELRCTEGRYFTETADVDSRATKLYQTDPAKAVEMVTNYSYTTAETAVKDRVSVQQSAAQCGLHYYPPHTATVHPLPSHSLRS
jgi:dipeptidase